MKKIILPILLFITVYTTAQVGIGTKIPEPSAMLEVKSNNKGVLISRMTESERAAIKSPASGLLVYQTDGIAGFYYHTGSEWKYLPPATIASAAQPIAYSTSSSSYTVSSVSGASNRITSSGGTAPVIDIASTYPGQPSITTLGTIGTGTWNGSVISNTKGGAGSVNGLLKANGSGTVSAAVSGTDYLKPNTAITAATKTKLTYNAQGLVTGGSDASTSDIAEGNNKYYTDSRSRAALSLTTLGTSGAATYNKTTGVLNIPQYSGGSGGTSYSFASPLALNTGTVSIPQANSVTSGYLTSSDWNTFNNKLSTAAAASTYATITSVNGKLTSNNAITGATKTKITYDSKGLVTSGADATTTDIAEGTNLYFTEQRALNTVLSGFVAGPTSPVLTSDDIVSAFGKLQAQINKYDSLAEKISKYDSLQAQIIKQDSLISLLNKRIDSLANSTASDSSSTVNLSRGLVAYYPFTGNAGDSSGNGNHGTVNGATLTTDRFGNANKAYSFDGVNNWISVLHNSSLNPTSKISISFWEKSTSIHNNCGIIGKWNNFDGVSGNGQEQYVIYAGPNSQGVRFIVMTNNNASISDEHASVKYNDGIWHHFVGVYNGSNIKLYRDNVLIDSTSLTGSIKTFSQGLEIGRYAGGSGTGSNVNYFNGLIDDIRIYDRDLTQSEISVLASDTLNTNSGLPVLTTTSISDTTAISASSGGNISSAGGSSITARGIVWGTSSNPTISLSTKTTNGTGTGSYSSQISGLTASTTYYVRAYATNTAGTSYGNEVSFTTNTINLTNGLVAYYPFTGNAGDSSGNGNHGTVNGATLTTDRFGNVNRAYSFDGTSSFIEVPDSKSLSIEGDITMAAWVYDNGPSNNYHTILTKELNGDRGYNLSYSFYYGPGGSPTEVNKIFSGRRNGNGAQVEYKFSNQEISFNKWQYIAAVVRRDIITFYIDGVEVGYNVFGNQFTIPMINQLVSLKIGSAGGGNQLMPGKLDEIRIYNRALTQSEISLLASDTVKTNTIPTSVTIGTQIWTDKNLDVSTYQNGDIIPQVTDNATWESLTTGAWCYYNNDSTKYAKFGKLYNWYAVNDSRGLAPEGWHIPSDTEWANLGTYLGGKSVAGGKMKEVGIINWSSPNTDATNETGFTGLPGGIRIGVGTFNGINSFGNWWSSTQNDASTAWGSSLAFNYANLGVHEGSGSDKQDGFSIRCIRD